MQTKKRGGMKLIIVYGPPAVGKLTVARELAKLTGYKVFHNHLTVDMVEPIFDFGSKEYHDAIDRFRSEMIEMAAKKGIDGIIFTGVYARTERKNRFLKKLMTIVKKHGGKTYFVQLYADASSLEKRVLGKARKGHNKAKDVLTLRDMFSRNNLFESIDFHESMFIDNTNVTARKAALRIRKHYRL